MPSKETIQTNLVVQKIHVKSQFLWSYIRQIVVVVAAAIIVVLLLFYYYILYFYILFYILYLNFIASSSSSSLSSSSSIYLRHLGPYHNKHTKYSCLFFSNLYSIIIFLLLLLLLLKCCDFNDAIMHENAAEALYTVMLIRLALQTAKSTRCSSKVDLYGNVFSSHRKVISVKSTACREIRHLIVRNEVEMRYSSASVWSIATTRMLTVVS